MSDMPPRARPAQTKVPAKGHGPQVDAVDPAEEGEGIDPSTGMPLWLDIGLPWASSGMLHLGVGLIILFLMLVFGRGVKSDDDDREAIVIPTAALTDGNLGPPGGVPNPGTGGDPTRDAAQDKLKDVLRSDGWCSIRRM